jgi:hypothetical protein
MPYVKKGRDPKEVARIAALDQAPVESLSPDEQRKRIERERKRAERAAAKAAEQKRDETKRAERDSKTVQEWWASQRAHLTDTQRAEFQTRHEEMCNWVSVLDEYVRGVDGTTEKDLQDTIEDVKALVEKYGELDTGFIAVSRFWSDATLQAVIDRAELVPKFRADAVLAKFGYMTAIPCFVLEAFRAKFMQPKRESKEPAYATVVCDDCGTEQTVLKEVLKHTSKPPCQLCKAVNTVHQPKSAMTTEEVHERIFAYRESQKKSGPEDEIYDGWGRFKS